MRFEGRTAIITGAASGMGLLTSQKLAEEGAIVYMADINEERLEREAQAIRESGGRAIACVTDLREYDQIFRTAERVMKDEGHIDILVNFAGGFPPRMCGKPTDFLHEDLDVIDWGIQVNFRAPMLFDRVVLGHMIDNKRGVIIHIGSVDGETGGAMQELRSFLFDRVYYSPEVLAEENRAKELIFRLFAHYCRHPDEMPEAYSRGDEPVERRVCDFISGMTDRHAISRLERLTIPRGWTGG